MEPDRLSAIEQAIAELKAGQADLRQDYAALRNGHAAALEALRQEIRRDMQASIEKVNSGLETVRGDVKTLGHELKVILLKNERDEKDRLRQERADALERSGQWKKTAEEAQQKLAAAQGKSPVDQLIEKYTPRLKFIGAVAVIASLLWAIFKFGISQAK